MLESESGFPFREENKNPDVRKADELLERLDDRRVEINISVGVVRLEIILRFALANLLSDENG